MSTDSDILKLIGNDIVDLALPETLDKAADNRYIKHVCAADECNFLSSAPDRHTALWAMWAAKEAAFKVVGKIHPELGFSPRKYLIGNLLFDSFRQNKIAAGTINYNHYFISVRWFITCDYVHCTALWTNRTGLPVKLRSAIGNAEDKLLPLEADDFSTREMLSVRSDQSRQVRRLTKQLLSDNGVKNVEIVRDSIGERLSPPYVLQDNARCEKYDVSMSHHGRFIAASILL